MREFFLVFRFELQTMLKKKSFVISTALVVLGAFVLLSLPRFFMSEEGVNDNTTQGSVDGEISETDLSQGEEKAQLMIYAEVNDVLPQAMVEMMFPDYQITYAKNVDEMQDAIINETAECGFAIHDATHFTYYVNNSSLMDSMSARFAQLLEKQYQLNELEKLNYDVNQVNAIYETKVQSEMQVLGTDGMNNYFYTYALIFILYMMILIYGNQIGVGVASEKSNRAIEILTTSCSPNALIFGKVIAGAVVGALQTLIMIGSILFAYQLNADSLDHMLDPYLNIPAEVLITFAMFGILGYLLFSFLFGAIGAMCSKLEEVNGATMPIQLLIIVVFFISMLALDMPDALFSKIAMYVPFTSWMCMFVNVAVGSVSAIELVISLSILAFTTVAMGLLGAKLYRRGTLTYGNSLKLKHMIRMLKRKD